MVQFSSCRPAIRPSLSDLGRGGPRRLRRPCPSRAGPRRVLTKIRTEKGACQWQTNLTITTVPTSRSSRAWRRSASVRACTSARRAHAACITWCTRSWTTQSTRRSPATATPSRCGSTPTTPSRSTTTGAASPWTSTPRRRSPRWRSSSPSCMPAASSAARATRCPAACTAWACRW